MDWIIRTQKNAGSRANFLFYYDDVIFWSQQLHSVNVHPLFPRSSLWNYLRHCGAIVANIIPWKDAEREWLISLPSASLFQQLWVPLLACLSDSTAATYDFPGMFNIFSYKPVNDGYLICPEAQLTAEQRQETKKFKLSGLLAVKAIPISMWRL